MQRLPIVDDEDSFREFVEMALRMEGYSVLATDDGQNAIDMLQEVSLDLIILDLCLLWDHGGCGYAPPEYARTCE